MTRKSTMLIVLATATVAATIARAEEEKLEIAPGVESVSFDSFEGPVTIERFANDIMLVKGAIRPMIPVPGVTPVGELEVINALQDPGFIVVDTRTRETQYGGTIPGSRFIVYSEIAERLGELGCEERASGWTCSGALNVVVYCNGPNCSQSPRAIAALVEAGFPATKLYYYRGGMLAWTSLGLTTRERE